MQEKKGREPTNAISWSPWRLLPLVAVAAGLVAFFAVGLDRYLSFETLKEHREALLDWQQSHAILAALAFVGLYAAVVAFSLPVAALITIAGGFLFGPLPSTIYAVVGATLGATLIFLAARYALRDYLRSKAGRMVSRMEQGFRENALSYLLVLRLIPIFPLWLVNLVPALLGVPLRIFVIGTFIGIIPGSFVYALVGNGLGAVLDAGGRPDLSVIFKVEILAPILGLALLSLVPVAYKRIKGSKPAKESP